MWDGLPVVSAADSLLVPFFLWSPLPRGETGDAPVALLGDALAAAEAVAAALGETVADGDVVV